MRKILLIAASIFLAVASTSNAENQSQEEITFSSDTDDLCGLYNPFVPIGSIDELRKIIDLRGFLPISGGSARKKKAFNDLPAFDKYIKKMNYNDIHQWYKYPLKQGIAWIFYGGNKGVSKVNSAQFVREDSLSTDERRWALLAYELAKSEGENLFKASGGPSGFESAEPIAILFTDYSALIIMNFRYTAIYRERAGQLLNVYEFSRSLNTYKSYYKIYNTFLFQQSDKDLFKASSPFITEAAKLILVGQ